MKKEILLYQFGDNEPAYAQWNVENFRKMNPGWEIEYAKDNAAKSLEAYAKKYMQCVQHVCICCSIKCFPIAPFDTFMSMSHFCAGSVFCINNYIASNIQYAKHKILQLQKDIDLKQDIIQHKTGIYANQSSMQMLENRVDAFNDCTLDLHSMFCNNVLSPVESLGENS